MRWRAYLAWYDGQIGLQGVFPTEEEARFAAQTALDDWRAGKLFPEWNDAERDAADPVIRLNKTEIPVETPDEGQCILPESPSKPYPPPGNFGFVSTRAR